MKPGRLDRGEELESKRPWEVEGRAKQGPGLSVKTVAEAGFEYGLDLDNASGKFVDGQFVMEHDDIVAYGQRPGRDEL